MRPFTTYEIANIVKGKVIAGEDVTVTGVCQDSRLATEGSLFVAIDGDAFDGHDFIGSAMEKGCVAVIADNDKKAATALSEAKGKVCLIIVESSEKALQDLASSYIRSLELKKVAVTGSTGKTTTRDMLYHVLKGKYKTGKNEGNFNSTVGVPLTIMTFDDDIEAAVIEMGMDKPGEISIMTNIVEPDIAVITNVGVSHMERLGSREAIFRAKMEITETLDDTNTLIVARDDMFLNKENIREKIGGNFNIITVGEDKDCDFVVSEINMSGDGRVSFNLTGPSRFESGEGRDIESLAFHLPIPGKHNAINGSLAVAAGIMMGVSMKEAAEGLEKMILTGKRLSVERNGGITVIDDTYNASPDSMKAALDILSNMDGKRKIAVLGDMYELGDEEEELHRQVGQIASEKADILFTLGELGKFISCENHFNTVEEFKEATKDFFKDGDVVLVKASRGMALERITEYILNEIGER